MSTSYGHQIQPMGLVQDTRLFRTTYKVAEQRPAWKDPSRLEWVPNCSSRLCDGQPVFASRYFYVTGRAGRVTDRIQYWCQACGEKWTARHCKKEPVTE